jgi:dolichol-phosphate mannosyltransferase
MRLEGVSPQVALSPPRALAHPVLSIVVPAYNEEGSVAHLVERVAAVMGPTGVTHEIVLVDDGSRDATWARIVDVARRVPAVRGVRLARNFGHQHALLAGLAHARGRAIVSMDAALQHPPEVLPELLHRWEEGALVVATERLDAGVTGPFKRLSSRYFYRAFAALTGIPMRPGMSDFRLVDRSVRDELLRFRHGDVFLRGTVQWLGYPTATVHFEVGERYAGASKYTLRRMLGFASGAVVSFSAKPLYVAIWMGLLTGLASLAELAYVVVQYVRGRTVPGWASIVGVTSLFFGILFILLGIIGVYIARIHEMLQNRPAFVVAEQTPAGERGEGGG